jgi:hypothetical protein
VQRQYFAWSIAGSGKAKLPKGWRRMKETPNHEKPGGGSTKGYQPGQSEEHHQGSTSPIEIKTLALGAPTSKATFSFKACIVAMPSECGGEDPTWTSMEV